MIAVQEGVERVSKAFAEYDDDEDIESSARNPIDQLVLLVTLYATGLFPLFDIPTG